ncbi:MAG: nucleoside hydrolase [Spirochaetaceae bacterium]|jgi:pyrimidine-specific ribonucleoside hydrolase|nr:nucleoside hydrolase [Spirochaetaceae bacterium]
MTDKIPVIIDCDPGHDDAMALVLAFANQKLDIRAVTVTGGNQTLAKTLRNAKNVLHCLGKQPLVAAGADKPLCRDLQVAPNVHGETGLDGTNLAEAPWSEVKESAWELTHRLIEESEKPITLITLGPLTNIAILLSAYPKIRRRIKRISLMGGSVLAGGNWTSAAEFNIVVDPEAADIVFTSGIPITMCGLDVTHKAMILPPELAELKQHGGRASKLVSELVDFYWIFHSNQGFAGAPLHDPCAVAALAAPELFTMRDMHIDIETRGTYTTGMTLADHRMWTKAPPNASVCLDLNRPAFIRLLIDACKSYG